VELRTRRLILRPYALADFEESAAMWADPVVVRYVGNVPVTREQAWQKALRTIGFWTAFGFGMFTIRDHEGRFVGEVGVWESKRDLEPPFEGLEAGWVLALWAHGQGLASEALAAALAWFDQTHGPRDIMCMIDPPNAPSRRVAAKHGFVETSRPRYHDQEVIVFTRPSRPDPASRASS
jgi:RimJ/RimL family protein N-acetyltransferase